MNTRIYQGDHRLKTGRWVKRVGEAKKKNEKIKKNQINQRPLL